MFKFSALKEEIYLEGKCKEIIRISRKLYIYSREKVI